MFVIVIARAWRTSARPRERMLAILATFIFAFFVYSAWRRPAEANWPALAYIPAVALLAATEGALPWRGWLVAGCVLGGAASEGAAGVTAGAARLKRSMATSTIASSAPIATYQARRRAASDGASMEQS